MCKVQFGIQTYFFSDALKQIEKLKGEYANNFTHNHDFNDHYNIMFTTNYDLALYKIYTSVKYQIYIHNNICSSYESSLIIQLPNDTNMAD